MSELGLRERKVAESRLRAECAAIDLCLEHGFEAVTVDMICESAEISARTFYNYFGTREGALLGAGKPMPDEATIAAYIAVQGDSEVEHFATLVAQTYEDSGPNRELVRKRRELLDASTELAALNFARVTQSRGQYADIVTRRLMANRPHLPAAEVEQTAQFIVAVTMGAIQVIGRSWIHGNIDVPMRDYLSDAFVTIRDITQTPRPAGESITSKELPSHD